MWGTSIRRGSEVLNARWSGRNGEHLAAVAADARGAVPSTGAGPQPAGRATCDEMMRPSSAFTFCFVLSVCGSIDSLNPWFVIRETIIPANQSKVVSRGCLRSPSLFNAVRQSILSKTLYSMGGRQDGRRLAA